MHIQHRKARQAGGDHRAAQPAARSKTVHQPAGPGPSGSHRLASESAVVGSASSTVEHRAGVLQSGKREHSPALPPPEHVHTQHQPANFPVAEKLDGSDGATNGAGDAQADAAPKKKPKRKKKSTRGT